MPVVRTNKRSASPVEAHSNPFGAVDPAISVPQLNFLSLPPQAPESDATLSQPSKKKRSHGKARPAGHIPRPPNAFIIFRTDYIKTMDTHSTPEVSKNLGKMWKAMSPLEKEQWVEKAEEAKAKHKEQYPDYKYKPVHPRDAEGRCIRKPRKPNQPRVKTATDLEHMPASYPWFEGKGDTEFPSISLPSDTSSISSPPRSPSPAVSEYYFNAQPFYQTYRRSSSVPIPGADRDDRLCFGTEPQSAYPSSPTSLHTRHVSRRLSKRPSTSMDFTCAGPNPPESYGAASNAYLSAGDASHGRLGHRRSISAPGLGGDVPMIQFANAPSHSFAQEASPLTPINPVFGDVFNSFSWDTTSNSQQTFSHETSTVPPYISVDIPSMSNSPISNFSAITTPPVATPFSAPSRPVIHHPTPVPPFDFSAFQSQISEFDIEHVERGGLDNALGLAYHHQPYPVDAQTGDHQFYPVEAGQNVAQEVHAAGSAQGTTFPAADVRSYGEGVHYTRPEIVPPQPLDFNDLIEGY